MLCLSLRGPRRNVLCLAETNLGLLALLAKTLASRPWQNSLSPTRQRFVRRIAPDTWHILRRTRHSYLSPDKPERGGRVLPEKSCPIPESFSVARCSRHIFGRG